MAVTIMLGLLGLIALVFAVVFFMDIAKHKDEAATGVGGAHSPLWISALIGFVTNFFDTLGIGSFAPTTAAFKATKVVDDGIFPGTLNVGHTLPVVFMSFLYITTVAVDFVTLVALIAASVVGAWFGAGIVAKFNRARIQLIMGIALIIVAGVMGLRNAGIIAGWGAGNVAIGLYGGLLIAGIIIHVILGALMTAGVGLYAPSMAAVYLLGLSPAVAFPVMMGACAFLMPVASIKFVQAGTYARKQSLAIGLAGLPGVFLAFQFFRGMWDLGMLIWMVIVVITITGIFMIRASLRGD